MTQKDKQQGIVIAHRGASAYAPENTLPAMRLAHEKGAHWVECDVVLSADGQPYIFHDERLERTSTGHGNIATTSSDCLNQLDAGSWFSERYAGTPIPTLSALLCDLKSLKLGLNLELKPADQRYDLLVNQVVALLEDLWTTDAPPCLLSSFSLPCLKAAHSAAPHIPRALLLNRWQPLWQTSADRYDCIGIHLPQRAVTEKRVAEIKASGRFVGVYTVNARQEAEKLFAWGVDRVFSDYPDLMEDDHDL